VVCPRCGRPGVTESGGGCAACAVDDRIRALLGDEKGVIAGQLRPLADALCSANPGSMLTWLRRSPAVALLKNLVEQPGEITDETLDRLVQDRNTAYLRQVLVTTTILPPRDEPLAQLGLWTAATTSDLPVGHQRIIQPFAEWDVLRGARRRAARGRYTVSSAAAARRSITTAIGLLTWLDTHHIDLIDLTQHHVDHWLTTHPAKRLDITPFLKWITARRLTGPLDIPTRNPTQPCLFIDHDTHQWQLRRCLTDDTLPLEVRVVGALIRLYALPLTRIAELTTDRYHHDSAGAYLTLDRHPVLLPPRLAGLVEQLLVTRATDSALRHVPGQPAWLLPGRPPSRPRSTTRPASTHETSRTARHRRPQHRHDPRRHRPAGHHRRRPVRHPPHHRPHLGATRANHLDRLPRRTTPPPPAVAQGQQVIAAIRRQLPYVLDEILSNTINLPITEHAIRDLGCRKHFRVAAARESIVYAQRGGLSAQSLTISFSAKASQQRQPPGGTPSRQYSDSLAVFGGSNPTPDS
jgi:hypothetical protein